MRTEFDFGWEYAEFLENEDWIELDYIETMQNFMHNKLRSEK
jgi:hypothetical protein